MRVFLDRADGGRELAKRLAHYRGMDTVVYGLPRGGVVTAKEVADEFGARLDVIVTRKIGHPRNPEFAIGAVTEDGEVSLNATEVEQVAPEWLAAEIFRQTREAQRRERIYLSGRPPIPVEGRVAIVVDDGIATGYTMETAVRAVRKLKPLKVVVASPVAPVDVLRTFTQIADEVVVVVKPDFLYAVGQFYKDFAVVRDDAVIEILRERVLA